MKYSGRHLGRPGLASHPSRVCGLNAIGLGRPVLDPVTPFTGVWLKSRRSKSGASTATVTPFTGVWIEILPRSSRTSSSPVTPFTGVWIEISSAPRKRRWPWPVTPFTGVWIEMLFVEEDKQIVAVTPFTGVWIEILKLHLLSLPLLSHPSRVCGLKFLKSATSKIMRKVTPFTGVWIEIALDTDKRTARKRSHPSRVCGLKFRTLRASARGPCGHTLHGCVD